MLQKGAVFRFIQREIFYLAVIAFDVLVVLLLMLKLEGGSAAKPLEVPRQLSDIETIFTPKYLEWAQRTKPFLVMGLVLFVTALVIAGIIGLVLLVRAGLQAARGRSALKQHPLLETRWNLWDVVKIAAINPFLLIIGYSALVIMVPLKGASDEALLLASLGVNYFAMIGALLFMWRVVRVERGQPLAALGYALPDGASDLGRAAACYAALLPLLLAAAQVTQAVASRFGAKPKLQEIVPLFFTEESTLVTAAILLLACVVAPIVEESFFRGFLQPAVRQVVGQRGGIIITAALFALAHHSLSIFLPIFVLGLVLGYLYEKTQSTFASAALHAIHNTVTTCFLLVIKHLPVERTPFITV
jgi:membrane protease YdiL (CAAX protease family)